MNIKKRELPGWLNSVKFGKITSSLTSCLERTVLIEIGLIDFISLGLIYSGLMNDEDAPVSIKNFNGRPKGEEMLT